MRKDIDTVKRYLDDLLADLADDAVVYLTIEEPTTEGEEPDESVWHGTITDLFEKDLDVILDSLDASARLYVNGRSGTDVFALAAPDLKDGPISWHLFVPAPDREVYVASLSPLGDAESLMEYVVDVPIPGIGGVRVLGEGDPIDPDDEGIDAYLDKIDEMFGEGDEDGTDEDDKPEADDEADTEGSADDVRGDGPGPRGGPGGDAVVGEDRRRGQGVDGDAVREDEPDQLEGTDSVGGSGSVDDYRGRDQASIREDRVRGEGSRDQISGHQQGNGQDHVEPVLERAPAARELAGASEGPEPGRGSGYAEEDGGEQAEVEYTVGIGEAKNVKDRYKGGTILAAKKVSGNQTGPLGALLEWLATHETGDKVGLYVLQGRVVKKDGADLLHRVSENMRDLCLAGLDLDAGTMSFEELTEKLRAFGKTVVAYSTHSHMKDGGAVRRSKIARALKKDDVPSPVDRDLLVRYLAEKEDYPTPIAESVEITRNDDLIEFKHSPWPKFRLIFPLAQPFNTLAQDAKHEWPERLRGLAEAVGVPHDPACKDFARLFYTARHEEGREYESFLMYGELLDIYDVDRVKEQRGRKLDPFSDFARSAGTGQGDVDLRRALAIIGDKLDLPVWLDHYAPDCLTGEDRDNGGVFTVCPHYLWDGRHSDEIEDSPQGSYAVGVGEDENETFMWHCSHASCQEFDRMDRIACVIENVEEATVESLFDANCLVLTSDDPEAEELLEHFHSRGRGRIDDDEPGEQEEDEEEEIDELESIVRRYESGEVSWSNCVALLADGWLDLEMDVRARTCHRLVKPSKLSQAVIRKTIEAHARGGSKQVSDERKALINNGQEWRDSLSYMPIRIGDETFEVVEPSPLNVAVFLENHDLLSGRVLFNNLRERPYVVDRLPWDNDETEYPREWNKFDKSSLRTWFYTPGTPDQMRVKMDDINHGLDAYLNAHRYDPVREYLRECRANWDGTPRLDDWLIRYCGAADTAINRAIGAKWMISAVARQAEPGCQAKYVLILESDQDAGKSKAFAILGGEWFTEDVKDFHQKDTAQIVATNWIIEMPELGSIKRSQVEEVKAFLSKTTEEFRSPYGEYNVKRPRQCVFAGTTNETEYLTDPTGNVRFWPVKCRGQVEVVALEDDRDQLWGEAVARYEADERWWFDYRDEADLVMIEQLNEARSEREVEDPLSEDILFHLTKERPTFDDEGKPIHDWEDIPPEKYRDRDEQWEGFTLAELMKLIGVDFKVRRGSETRVGNILSSMGYEKRQMRIDGKRKRLYYLTNSEEEDMAA